MAPSPNKINLMAVACLCDIQINSTNATCLLQNLLENGGGGLVPTLKVLSDQKEVPHQLLLAPVIKLIV